MSAKSDQSDHAAQLSAQFGGTWTCWTGGAAGIPGAALWTQHQPDEHGRPVITGMLLFTDRVTTDALRKIPASVLEDALAGVGTSKQAEDLAALPPLERGSLSKSEFLALVAEHFKTWSRYSPKPSRDMARASGVKENTIYSWIREARAAGLLPPGRSALKEGSYARATSVQPVSDVDTEFVFKDETYREERTTPDGAVKKAVRRASNAGEQARTVS